METPTHLTHLTNPAYQAHPADSHHTPKAIVASVIGTPARA